MSARLFRSVLSYRRYSFLVRSISLQSTTRSYAIVIPQGVNLLTENVRDTHFPQKMLYTTQVARKERVQDANSLLTNIISHYKVSGYVQYEQCLKLLDALENANEVLTKENIQFLLHACGAQMPVQNDETRMELFQRFWSFLKEHNLLTKDSYIQKLQIWQHNRIPLDDLQLFLKDIATVASDALETPELFGELLNVACSCGNMQSTMEVLAAMRERNFALNEKNFNALVMGHGRNHDLHGIQTTMDSMQAAGIVLSNETQATLVIAYLENNENSKAFDMLRQYQGKFNGQQILKILRVGMRIELDDEMITFLIRELPVEYTIGPDISFELRQLCNDFLHNGKFNIVKNIIFALPKPSFSENQSIDTYASSILAELFRAKLPEEEIINFAEALKSSEKNRRALHIVSDIAMRRNPSSALVYLKALSKNEPLRPHYFWPMIMYNFRTQGESGILTTLQHMKRLNVDCDNETLVVYVIPHMRITLENPIQSVKLLTGAGIKTSLLLTPLLKHLLAQQKMTEALQIVELYPIKIDVLEQLMPTLQPLSVNVRATKRYQQFAKLLSELFKRAENQKVDFVGQLLITMLNKQERLQQDLRSFQRFLTEIQKIGLHISPGAVSSLETHLNSLADEKKNDEAMKRVLQTLQQMKDRNLVLLQNAVSGINVNSSFIKHPRDMSLRELECHLIELESKGMNTRGVLRRLLQLYVRDNCLERALDIKAKCDKLRVQESPGMLASIFDLYIKIGDLFMAEDTLKRLQKTYPGFQLDEHKFIDYAALLVRDNQLPKSLTLLAGRSDNQRISGGDYVIKNVWNFLTSVAQLAARHDPKLPAEKNWTREAFQFLRKCGYCNAHNAVLGPIVREYLLRGDIRSAVLEFCEFATQYKHTPLQFELLSLLVRLGNGYPEEVEQFAITTEEAQKLLNDVTSLISKVHGTTNMNSALVLAFAESGTDNQLRRLLMNPQFRINHELLQKNCEHLGKEGSVRTLLRLAKGARGLNHAINEQTIYDLLLNNFVKTNDYTAALDLFERLDADDELKMSSDFVKNVVNLLKVNKVEVPSNVELRAYINRVKI